MILIKIELKTLCYSDIEDKALTSGIKRVVILEHDVNFELFLSVYLRWDQLKDYTVVNRFIDQFDKSGLRLIGRQVKKTPLSQRYLVIFYIEWLSNIHLLPLILRQCEV